MEKPSVLPTGIVTFLFTDIEGSTSLWEAMPEEMQSAVKLHHDILRQTIEANGGHVFQIVGDAFQAAFRLASEGVIAAIEAQRALKSAEWGATKALQVRMGLHTGPVEIDPIPGPCGVLEYSVNHTLNRAARIMSAGQGGQILLSQEAADLVMRNLNGGASLADLGEHRLKGMQQVEHLYQVMAPGLPQQFPPLATSVIPPNNLPIQLTSFIGREKEIAEIQQALCTNRLVTLTGSGGTGKTRLALEVASRELEHYHDGAWLVELAPVNDPKLVAITILTVFGLGEQPGQLTLQLLQDFLRTKELLIIFDNCEHLIEASARIAAAVLKAAPKVKILATSREALGVSGELAWRVPSLSLPDPKATPEIERLRQYEAVRLFVERASLVHSQFVLQPENAQAITQVCCRLDGIPLAIELAAARLKLLSPSQIAAKLDDRFRLLSGGSRTALPRQQTLRAMIDWSYGLLTEDERQLFCRLAVFSGGWTLEEAEQVCADEQLEEWEILDLLGRLVDKSLVIVKSDEEDNRYRMLETIRQYAREKMFDSGEAEDLRDRHLACFLALAEKAEPEVRGHDQLKRLNSLMTDIDNLRASLEWAQHRDTEVFLRLASALWRFWDYGGHRMEGNGWLLSALDLTPNLRSAGRVKALARASINITSDYDSERAFQLAEEAVGLGEELQDKPAIALAYLALNRSAEMSSRKWVFQPLQEKGLALCRELRDHWLASWYLADYATDPFDQEREYAAHEEGIKEARLAGDLRMIGYCLSSTGFTALFRGDIERAHEHFLEGISIVEKIGDRFLTVSRYTDLAFWALYVEDYTQAEQLYLKSFQIFRDIGAPLPIADVRIWLAKVAKRSGNINLFLARVREAEEAISQQTLKGKLAWQLSFEKGVGDFLLGHLEEAKDRIRSTLKMSVESSSYVPFDCLRELAYLAAEQGQIERAVRLLAAHDSIIKQTWWPVLPLDRRICQGYLNRALEQLGAEAYAANWERGKAMSKEEAFAYALDEGG